MAGNSGRNVAVYYKAQSVLGTPESGAGASVLRINNSTAGFALQKAKIRSNESRNDGMSTRGRPPRRRASAAESRWARYTRR